MRFNYELMISIFIIVICGFCFIFLSCHSSSSSTGNPHPNAGDKTISNTPLISETRESTGNSSLILRDFSTPISAKEIASIRKNNVAISGSNVYSVFNPKSSADKLVAYGYVILTDGLISEFAGFAGNEKSASIVQTSAKRWYEEEKDKSSQADRDGNDISMPEIGVCRCCSYKYPYGGIISDTSLYKRTQDNQVDYDYFALRQSFTMIPGITCFNSEYLNSSGVLDQSWGSGDLVHGLSDWSPMSTINGPVSYESSVLSNLRWIYSQQDVSTNCLSSSLTVSAGWEILCSSTSSRNSICTINPGSSAKTYQLAEDSDPLLLVKVNSKGTFYARDRVSLVNSISYYYKY
jgi:hypothetical protein